MNIKIQLSAFFISLCLIFLPGCGRDFSAERKELRQKAAELAREQAMAELDPAAVAKELQLPWPVAPPQQTPDQVKKQVNEQVSARVAEKFPPEMLADLRRQVEKKYPLIKPGTEVEFIVNDGEGVNPVAKGLYKGMNKLGRYEIGDKTYHPDEFRKEDLAKLNPVLNDRQIETEYRQKVFLAKEDAREFGTGLFADMFPQAMAEARYTRVEDEWVPMRTRIEQVMGEKIARKAKKLEPQKQRQVFTRNGFAMKDGEWQPTLKKRILGK